MSRFYWDSNSEAGSGEAWNTDDVISISHQIIIPDELNRNQQMFHREIFENAIDIMSDASISAVPATYASEVDEPLTAEQMQLISDRFDGEYRFNVEYRNQIEDYCTHGTYTNGSPDNGRAYMEIMNVWKDGLTGLSKYDAIFKAISNQDDDLNKKVHDIIKDLMKA